MISKIRKIITGLNGEIILNRIRESYFKKHHFKIYKEILKLTPTIPKERRFVERLFCILNKKLEGQRCNCGQLITFRSLIFGYVGEYCSLKCAAASEKTKKLRKETNMKSFGESHYFKTQDYIQKNKSSNLKKYGVEYYTQTQDFLRKKEATNLKKYGVEHFCQTEAYKLKSKKTCLQKYGVEHPCQLKEIKEKINKTNLIKYGKEYYFQTKKYKDKTKKTCFQKYGVSNYSKTEEFKKFISQIKQGQKKSNESIIKLHKTLYLQLLIQLTKHDLKKISLETYLNGISNNSWEFQCSKCETNFKDTVSYNGRSYRCPSCYPYKKSKPESELKEYLKDLDIKINNQNLNRKILNGLELDLYLPKHNLAIEYNGLMFHSFGKSKYSMFNNYELESLNKNKHLLKTQLCEKQDIQLLHINENEWLNSRKQNIWKSIISSKLGKFKEIYNVNDCYTKEIEDNGIKNTFLNKNHLEGEDKSSVKLGLYFKETNELLSLMTFGKAKYSKDKQVKWRLIRFSNKKFTSIVGSESKLLKYFNDNYLEKGVKIISYINKRYTIGNLYQNLGFKFSHTSRPNYYYFNEKNVLELHSSANFQKHKLKDKLDIFDSNLTETENMYNNGYRKIYDSGNLVYIL